MCKLLCEYDTNDRVCMLEILIVYENFTPSNTHAYLFCLPFLMLNDHIIWQSYNLNVVYC